MSRRQQVDPVGCLLTVITVVGGLIALSVISAGFDTQPLRGTVVLLAGGIFVLLIVRQRKKARLQAEEERQEPARQREAAQRHRIEAMLHPDRVRDEIDDMRGPEFERFMADLLRQKGYRVEETPLSGDQGVDLVLPDLDGKRVVIQLKRWTGPVGNNAIQATFAGMAHYQADEGWVITTSTFTKSARELARSTRVRLIDRDELADWLDGLR